MSSAYLQAIVNEHRTWPPFWPFAAAVATCPSSKYYKMKKNVYQRQLLLTHELCSRIWCKNNIFSLNASELRGHIGIPSRFQGPRVMLVSRNETRHARHVCITDVLFTSTLKTAGLLKLLGPTHIAAYCHSYNVRESIKGWPWILPLYCLSSLPPPPPPTTPHHHLYPLDAKYCVPSFGEWVFFVRYFTANWRRKFLRFWCFCEVARKS